MDASEILSKYIECLFISVALILDESVLRSHKTKVVTSGSKTTLGFHTPTDDHSRSPRALRLVYHYYSSYNISCGAKRFMEFNL